MYEPRLGNNDMALKVLISKQNLLSGERNPLFLPKCNQHSEWRFFFLLGWDKEKDFWPHRIPSISWGSDMLHLHQDPFRARLLRLNAHTRPKVLHRFYGGFPKNTFFLTPVVGIEKASQFLKWKKIYQGHVRALKHSFYIYFFTQESLYVWIIHGLVINNELVNLKSNESLNKSWLKRLGSWN